MRCSKPIQVRTVTLRGAAPILVACGRCPTCRLKARAQSAGQAALEGTYTREKLGTGHVWMATFTYSEDSVPWHEPEAHNLQDWLPRLTPRSDANAASLKGPDRAIYQSHRMRELYGMSRRDVSDFVSGTYPRIRTLDRRPLELLYKRARKAGLTFRKMEAGEYGERSTERPHHHVLFFGPTQEEFTRLLLMWDHGRVDPDPRTGIGQALIEDQVLQNANPGAAAKYACKYLTKDGRNQHSAATFARQHEYVRRGALPALGHHYALKHYVPVLEARFFRDLDSYAAELPQEPSVAGMLAAWRAHQGMSSFQLAGWWYPVSRAFRARVLAATTIPEPYLAAAANFATEVEQERTAQILAGGPIAERFYADLRASEAEEQRREATYLAQLHRKQARWAAERRSEDADRDRRFQVAA